MKYIGILKLNVAYMGVILNIGFCYVMRYH